MHLRRPIRRLGGKRTRLAQSDRFETQTSARHHQRQRALHEWRAPLRQRLVTLTLPLVLPRRRNAPEERRNRACVVAPERQNSKEFAFSQGMSAFSSHVLP